jgi:hypothetical protein
MLNLRFPGVYFRGTSTWLYVLGLLFGDAMGVLSIYSIAARNCSARIPGRKK